MPQELNNGPLTGAAADFHFSVEASAEDVAPWTEIEPGRFMPRRVRGSFQGRALG
jgi:hypothetical protein